MNLNNKMQQNDGVQFENKWRALKNGLEIGGFESSKSSMWRSLIKDFTVKDLSDESKKDIFNVKRFRGYNFSLKDEEKLPVKFTKLLLKCTYFIARLLNYMRNRVWQYNKRAMDNAELNLYPATVRTLKQLGIYKDHIAFSKHFDLSPTHANSMKHFYISSLIEPYFKDKKEFRVVEIGGGVGNLASIMNYRANIKQYVIIDLPEMLLVASLTLRYLFPDKPIFFMTQDSSDEFDVNKCGFYLCIPDRAQEIPDSVFDLALNIDSFQEMTSNQVSYYVELLQRIVREGGRFLNLNRRKYLAEENYDNNPLMYPYNHQNKVLRWETDYFMERTYNFNQVRLDRWILREEEIVK